MENLPSDLKYMESHEWARLEGTDTVTVGITDHAQKELGDLVYVELPEVGSIVSSGEQCAVVESVKAASDIYSPVTGKVIEVNDELVDSPEKVNDDAYAAWLFRVRADDAADELEQLMGVEAYRLMTEE